MGRLVKETPYCEMNATIEILDRLMVGRDDLARFRSASIQVQMQVSFWLKGGDPHPPLSLKKNPTIPARWALKHHARCSGWLWNQEEIVLLSYQEVDEAGLFGKEKEPSFVNACVHEFLLDNPCYIPVDWYGKYVCFFGTLYEYVPTGIGAVRALNCLTPERGISESMPVLGNLDQGFAFAVWKKAS